MITTQGEVAGQDVWRGKKRRHSSSSAAPLLSEQPLHIQSPFTLSLPPPLLPPSLTSPPFLNCQDGSLPLFLSHCFMPIFISACEMYSRGQQQALHRSSGLSHTPRAVVSASPFTLTQPLRSQIKSPTLDLVSSFHAVFYAFSFLPLTSLELDFLFFHPFCYFFFIIQVLLRF